MEHIIHPTSDNSISVSEALRYCRENKISKLTLEYGVYHFNSETADEDICCVSNHGHNGFKRCAFLIKNMQDFEVDGGGSLLIFHGAMNPFIVHSCENVTLRNFKVLFLNTNHMQTRVVEVGEDYVDLEACTEQGFYYEFGLLYTINECRQYNLVYSAVEMTETNGRYEFAHDTGEQCFGGCFNDYRTTARTDKIIRIHSPRRKPKLGNYVALIAAERYNNGILLLDSKNTAVDGATLYSCYGVGFHAQLCENVTISNCKTAAYPGDDLHAPRCFAINADATHFVGCSGSVIIRDCEFVNQFDDAINVHGVYTKIIAKTENTLTVKYVHYQCRGISLLRDGCEINVINQSSLIPYFGAKIISAKELNTETTVLTLDKSTDNINIGDLVDCITLYPDVVVENNRFVDNRARGILMASRKNVIIRNNYFHTPGTAIKLESDSTYWYESGCVQDLTIENNIFDDCKYISSNCWGGSVIAVTPRQSREDGKYFHGNVRIIGNDFSSCKAPIIDLCDINELTLNNNKLPDNAVLGKPVHCGKISIE
ncbi:MAG: hypothetical protein HFE63_08060 [Clostridiales bacterium]|nr:hypothetical protein [Clostridiales bacterium]